MADYIEGKRPVIEAFRTGVPMRRILMGDYMKRDPMIEDIMRKAKRNGVKVIQVPRAELDEKSARGSHQGVMAEAAPFNYAGIGKVRFRRMVRPGDTLEITSTLLRSKLNVYVVKGEARVDGQVCASGEFSFIIP